MTKDKKKKRAPNKKWFNELHLNFIGHSLTAISILIGVYQFNIQRKFENDLEFKRNVWLKEQDSYSSLLESLGLLISSTQDSTRFNKAIENFHAEYWGVISLTANFQVEESMKDVYLAIYDFDGSVESLNKIKYKSDILANSCKEALKKSWGKLE